ncbi:MAG: DUF1801 domain-containing protein [Bacteroidota bacterium]
MKNNPKIDIYIEKSQDFTKEILIEIRKRVHEICPEIEEEWKWSFPNFTLNGKILCSMASFKSHCSFGFWLSSEMKIIENPGKGMGDLGKMTSIDDLPSIEHFRMYMLEAMELTLSGKTITKKTARIVDFNQSEELNLAIQKSTLASNFYDKFSKSQQKDYHEWILEAKTETTSGKRITQAVEWISEGKSRHWKYQRS